MENNRINPSIQNGSLSNAAQDPNQKERDRKGEVHQVSDSNSYDDVYESRQEDEIVREEARTEKDNRPGKN